MEKTKKLSPEELIKYIFETDFNLIEDEILKQNKGLSGLCLLYKTSLSYQELTEKFGNNVQFGNINTSSVPGYINEINKYCDINLNFKNKSNDTNNSKISNDNLVKSLSPLKNTEQKIFFGSPGTGKSYKVDQIISELDTNFYERVTFHPEFDNNSFVGGYKPVSDKDGGISYKFVPQAFTNIYERAWLDENNQYYLVIEEINRGNCAEIFGDIFQLLDRTSNYTVSPSEELKNHLIEKFGNEKNHDGIANGLKLPPNLTMYATMNTSDQSLFPMDSAFKRRWEWEYVPINYEEFNDDKKENKSFYFQIDTENGSIYSWNDFIKKINISHIKENPSLGMDKCIGNYFIKPDIDNRISLKQFINKVIFYLWNDVFKDEENNVFEAKTSYEDFFPIETNGKTKIIELFQRIGLESINLKKDTDIKEVNSLTENNEG
jgi:hypothetical protein